MFVGAFLYLLLDAFKSVSWDTDDGCQCFQDEATDTSSNAFTKSCYTIFFGISVWMCYYSGEAVVKVKRKTLRQSVLDKSYNLLAIRTNLPSNFDSAPKPGDVISLPHCLVIEHEIRRVVESISNIIGERNRGYRSVSIMLYFKHGLECTYRVNQFALLNKQNVQYQKQPHTTFHVPF